MLDEESGFQGSEWSADFVSDASGEQTERREFFVAFNQSLAFDQFDPQRSDQVTINQHGEHCAEYKQQRDEGQDGDAKLRECLIGLREHIVARLVVRTSKFLSQIVEMAGFILKAVIFNQRRAGFLLYRKRCPGFPHHRRLADRNLAAERAR